MIEVFVVSATVGKQREIGEETREKISGLLKSFKNFELFDLISDVKSAKRVNKIKDKISGSIIVVSTGGTERIIRAISNSLKKPTLLWANPFNNSLASSLEAFSKLREKVPIKLFYSLINSEAIEEIKNFSEVCETLEKIKKIKIGCVGEPTKWPLTFKNKKIIRKFGPEIVKLKVEDLINETKNVNEEEVKNIFEKLKKSFGKIKVSEREIRNSAKIYLAMKRLITKHKLSAITIKCFDLLDYNYSACLGMSLCNDEGLIAGCEADIQATLTMMIVSFLTNQPCWMANPSRIDKEKNTITLAHCTIATKMIANLSKATLLPHMESGKFLSLRGPLKNDKATLVRLGGNLDKILIAPGKIVRSDMKEENLCRTQVEFKLEGNLEEWLENSLGNHQILVYGDIESKLLDFCKFKGIKPILIK
jgi:L-fucose isomerase-like protein